MEMYLTKASEIDIANKIKLDKSWLTTERLNYILLERPGVFNALKFKDVNPELLKESIKKEKVLFEFAYIAEDHEKWSKLLSDAIPRPLNNKIFKEDGILLNFLEEKEYEELAKKWVNNVKSNEIIPPKVQKFLEETKILSIIKNNKNEISFDFLSDNVKTLSICKAFIKNAYQHARPNLYKLFPQEIKDDAEIAFFACKDNKQFYKELTSKAKLHEKVIAEVIDDYIPPAGDYDTSHTDHTAIKIKELSIEAVLSINNLSLMKEILKSNKELLKNKKIQEKWLNKLEYQEDFLEYYEYFTEQNKENFKAKIHKMNNDKKANVLFYVPQLRDVLIDESNVNDSLKILFNRHMGSKNFAEALKVTKLKNLLNNNLEEYSKKYTKEYNDNNYQSKTKLLDFADWLVTQKNENYKQNAIEILSVVLKKDPNILNSDLEYRFNIKSYALKEIASEVYEYMDKKEENKVIKKKKM